MNREYRNFSQEISPNVLSHAPDLLTLWCKGGEFGGELDVLKPQTNVAQQGYVPQMEDNFHTDLSRV